MSKTVNGCFGNPELIDKFFIGNDKFLENVREMQKEFGLGSSWSKFPFYNIKKITECQYQIEIAVAGFPESSIDIKLEGNKLIVSGKVEQDDDKNDIYLHKGITNKPFERKFTLTENMVVNNAHYINGMLKITLDAMIEQNRIINIPISVKKESK